MSLELIWICASGKRDDDRSVSTNFTFTYLDHSLFRLFILDSWGCRFVKDVYWLRRTLFLLDCLLLDSPKGLLPKYSPLITRVQMHLG